MKISVVIPTCNRRDILKITLPTVLDQDLPPDQYEVIVVVGGVTDGTIELLHEMRAGCVLRVIEQRPNRGQADAKNIGIAAARGELVLLLDDDVVCDRSLLAIHLREHLNAANIVLFGPVLVHPDSPRSLAMYSLWAWTNEYVERLAREQEPRAPHELWICSNCSVRRQTLLECGGFDANMRRTHDDADLAVKLWKMGLVFRYQPAAVAHQLYVKSTRELVSIDAEWYGKNELFFCRRHPECRSYSALARLGEGSPLKRGLRRAILQVPLLLKPFFRMMLRVLEQFCWIPRIRSKGIRLLQLLRSIIILRSALKVAGSWQALQREFGLQLPVLLYHHVGPPQAKTFASLTVTPEQFERQVAWLARHGYVGIRPSDWLRWCLHREELPEKPVLLTFDDAYYDLVEHAFPVLERFGYAAGVFVVTRLIGKTNAWDETRGCAAHRLMTADQIREWAGRGIEFGAHTRTHLSLRMLTSEGLAEEIVGSKDDLTRITESPVISFAYPYGLYNEEVLQSVREAFDLALTCEQGLNNLQTDMHLLKRTMVERDDTLFDLACRVRFGWSPIQRVRACLRIRSRIAALRQRLFGN